MKFKKSEVAIYAIALMLVAAGYFNYMTFDNKAVETSVEDTGSMESVDGQYAGTGDAVLVSNNEISSIIESESVSNNEGNNENNSEDVSSSNLSKIDGEDDNGNKDKAINNEDKNERNYYANSKLDRDKMYAEMISSYEEVLNNTNVSEAQKSIATQEISKINNTKNAIMICENLILTKGFNNCIILVNNKIVNVVLNKTGGLQTSDVAKVQNIVSRELGTEIEDIHITEK